jgi:hypothetical protein
MKENGYSNGRIFRSTGRIAQGIPTLGLAETREFFSAGPGPGGPQGNLRQHDQTGSGRIAASLELAARLARA